MNTPVTGPPSAHHSRLARVDDDKVIDLRSDVFATPTETMWAAMRAGPFGWSYLGEDTHVRDVEQRVAELLGKEAGLLIPTCSMANLVALMTQAANGTQVVLGATAHIVTSEAWGVTSIVGAFPRLVDDRWGIPDPEMVQAVIVDAVERRLPPTSLVCLENTHNNAGGVAIDGSTVERVAAIAREHGARVHMDGARLFNASVAAGVPLARLARDADTVAINLNKGLGAPLGAVLAGSEAAIRTAHLNLKRIGGTNLHQAGRWAAAALVALDGWEERLAADHRRAARLAHQLAQLPRVRVLPDCRPTNIVLLDLTDLGCSADTFLARLATCGVLGFRSTPVRVRLVTSRAFDDADLDQAGAALTSVITEFATALATGARPETRGT